jgi:hypothetical protein
LILSEEGLLDKSLAQRLAAAVGLRNALVHGYLELVLDTVYRTIQEDLGDIEGFCCQIVTYLGWTGNGSTSNKSTRLQAPRYPLPRDESHNVVPYKVSQSRITRHSCRENGRANW